MSNYRPNYVPQEFVESLRRRPMDSIYIHAEPEQSRDSINKYTYTEQGYRKTEFVNNPDILAIGCSQTWGVGVPDDAIWAEVLSKNLSMSYFNLGVPGASIMHLVILAIDYIEKYGSPKYVVALWPDIRRILMPVDTDINYAAREQRADNVGDSPEREIQDVHFPHNDNENSSGDDYAVKFSKKPHVISEVNSYALPFFYSVQYIKFFTEYCKLKNIKMVFSSWDDDTIILLKELELKNFYFLDWLHYDKVQNDEIYINDCHLDMQDVYGINWCRGADHTTENRGHMGIHEHLDYAEMFERVIRDGQ